MLHPYLRVAMLLRCLLEDCWARDASQPREHEIPTVIAELEGIRQAGWFN
jgi:hypothetical protein